MTRQRNPYSGLPAGAILAAFGLRRRTPCLLDPVVSAKFTIGRDHKVATAGSCFAQHIARKLQATGFNYFVAEKARA